MLVIILGIIVKIFDNPLNSCAHYTIMGGSQKFDFIQSALKQKGNNMNSDSLCEIELDFLRDMFEKCRLQALFLYPDGEDNKPFDLGLRHRLGLQDEYDRLVDVFQRIVMPGNVYRVTDLFLCSYLVLELPQRDRRTFLLVGPYLSVEMTRETFLEQAEQQGLPSDFVGVLTAYYAMVPQLTEQTVFAPLETFCERLWGADGYSVVDVNQELFLPKNLLTSVNPSHVSEDILQKMEEMELRYAYENELMRAVSMGQSYKAELILSGFSGFSFERRLADPVRNLKNYAIIMNTLLRKAAEQGGVHPLYLDSVSSDYAHRIEQIGSANAGYGLMTDMFRGYCRLVRRHSMRNYSPPVRKAIAQIDADINGELGLKILADQQGINPSYLSTMFHKETGQTLTDYINQHRIQLAVQLLNGSDLQIQMVAQHCGIPDVNYFTKVFKKYVGKTPKQFRQESLHLIQTDP